MVSVIIPALNEEKTIAEVIRFCLSDPLVTEVIVVDDCSEDHTVEIANASGAFVICSSKRGKGISMKEGIDAAGNDVLVFLDADINPYPRNTIAMLSGPIINGETEFIKASFSRNAGRVTELLAKPLLHFLFPELLHFHQPLSGMIAGRKELFEKIEFIHDYGVDIGILIDMFQMGAKIREVNIGYIENKSKSWQGLGNMSREVAGAILQKALSVGKDISVGIARSSKPPYWV